MKTSEQIDEIAPALLEVQSKVPDPPRNGTNPHFGSDYATLDDIIHAARPVLTDHDIKLVQAPGMNGKGVTVETRLIHTSGQWISSTAASPVQKADPQGVGATITYLRRYGLASMLGLAHEEDDDANRAVHRDGGGERRLQGDATESQVNFIRSLLKQKQLKESVRDRIEERVDNWRDDASTIDKQAASELIDKLQSQPDADEDDDDLPVEGGKATSSFDCPECGDTIQPGMEACDGCGWLIGGPPADAEQGDFTEEVSE